MYIELLKVANDNPTRVFVRRHIAAVAPRLLIGREQRTVRLLVALAKINVRALLLDQNARRGDIAVDELGGALARPYIVHLDAALKVNKLVRLRNAKNLGKQCHPKGLRFLFLVPAPFPIGGELLCGGSALGVCHIVALRVCFSL